MTCSSLCYRHPSRESPFLIDLGQFVVQCKKIVLVIDAVLTMENFLEGELLILVYRQKRTVDVRIFSSQWTMKETMFSSPYLSATKR